MRLRYFYLPKPQRWIGETGVTVNAGESIQAAATAAALNATAVAHGQVWVYRGVYTENVVRPANVDITGLDRESCILDGTLDDSASGGSCTGLTVACPIESITVAPDAPNPTETFTERMVVLPDADGVTLRGWFTRVTPTVSDVGYAMSATRWHYPMEAVWTSAIWDNGGDPDATKVVWLATTPTGTSILMQARSAASAALCAAASWSDIAASGDTYNSAQFVQLRIRLRTLDPFCTPRVTSVALLGDNTIPPFWISRADWTRRGIDYPATFLDCEVDRGDVVISKNSAPHQWTKYWANPVMTKSGAGWRKDQISAGGVILDGATYKMWPGGNNTATWTIGYATSTDGITWTVDDAHSPVVSDGVDSHVIKVDASHYQMWYGRGATLAYATSTAGAYTWSAGATVYTTPVPHNAIAVTVVKIGSTYHAYWEEDSSGAWLIYHGIFTTPGAAITGKTLCVGQSTAPGSPRGIEACTPWATYDGIRVIGYLKGTDAGGWNNSFQIVLPTDESTV